MHCPHISVNSAKCLQDDCVPTTAYSAPGQAPSKDAEMFELHSSARWAVVATFFAVCLAGLLVAAALLVRTAPLRRVLKAPVNRMTTSFTGPPTNRLKHLADIVRAWDDGGWREGCRSQLLCGRPACLLRVEPAPPSCHPALRWGARGPAWGTTA